MSDYTAHNSKVFKVGLNDYAERVIKAKLVAMLKSVAQTLVGVIDGNFVMPDGTTLETSELPTERGKGAVCYHIADAAPGQWKMAYDRKNNVNCNVNWAPDISPIFNA